MFNPIATYRVQFHKGFSFSDLNAIIPYLQQLGVATLYASPIFSAVTGSSHGYDGINPLEINPEIGTEDQLRDISNQLRKAGIYWIQDIVPNHMAFHSSNVWLRDVMEKGETSQYASYFDIDWNSEVRKGKLMAPFLGTPVEKALVNSELKLAIENKRAVVKYYDSSYPINSDTLLDVTGEPDHFTAIQKVNNNTDLLRKVMDGQPYCLCHWQDTDTQINYRRFFTINGLICINIQHKEVFQKYHQLVIRLLEEGIFNGLRIDHIDGLYDPTDYLNELRALVGEESYIMVEKILQPGETLSRRWPVQGTTGYDFLAQVNNLLSNPKSEKRLTEFYRRIAKNVFSIQAQVREKKAYILHNHMAGELDHLYQLIIRLQPSEDCTVKKSELKEAISEFLVECPVYRYYDNRLPLTKEEQIAIRSIFKGVQLRRPDLASALTKLENCLLTKTINSDADYIEKATHFYKRCMQYTGPLMAKGVEDTLMYTYNRFIGHNDVGDSPEAWGISVEQFHQHMLFRQEYWPLALNTTSTHDTKRGEDSRARLNVLTDLAEEWIAAVKEWQTLNSHHKTNGFPDGNDEYMIYQSLIGAYPFKSEKDKSFKSRLQEYLQKALREEKTHTNWTTPNEEYENAARRFVENLLEDRNGFKQSLESFLKKVMDPGIVNSLSQLILKYFCPGIPDSYQGTELWDLAFVDPDNRRPVDYEKRQEVLNQILFEGEENSESFLRNLWKNREDGVIKLWLTHMLLKERKEHPQPFTSAAYVPLKTAGRYGKHVLSFARRYKQLWYVIVVPVHIAKLCKEQDKSIEVIDWGNTRIILRPETPLEWTHLLSGTKGKSNEEILVNDIFNGLPFAILKMQHPVNERGSGLLLSISSLPSRFGVGDLGPEAKAFARFLSRSRQKYWQILPLNPTEMGAGHSPYSSYSSMAGNPLLISPELLAEDGLLDKELPDRYAQPSKNKADYQKAEELREALFNIAYMKFSEGRNLPLLREFERFCENEVLWLDDMALYVTLKQQHHGTPWYKWDKQYKRRQAPALEKFRSSHANEIRKVKWLQFIFSRQWRALREYVNNLGIHFFGDMPFYVSYDSADVWSHPELFCLDKDLNMRGVAGVPPDYFSENGQLWGMPTFDWNKIKEQNYEWWIQRLRKNLEMLDLVRIDHFRAFQDYWQVPAGEETAKNGEWISGPGTEFFKVMRKALGNLPFVAEDLGDRMEDVYKLRDKVGLPGMKVLQFAWGENMPRSVDIPHNYKQNTIVYTGTHDNNTTVGWYNEEANHADHVRMHHYLNITPKRKNIHEILSRLACSSVGRMVILPVQDVLGLGAEARMNIPGESQGNWLWRLKRNQLQIDTEAMLRDWVETYNRI